MPFGIEFTLLVLWLRLQLPTKTTANVVNDNIGALAEKISVIERKPRDCLISTTSRLKT